MKVAEVVHLNKTGEFTNDVQLRWYAENSVKNLSLTTRYIFTRTSSGEKKSPIEILYKVKQAFLLDTYENRFVVIATYGHGKSHLALALANYFGRSTDSKEVGALFESIRCAHQQGPEAEAYMDFKTERKRHLVVCLEGTRLGDLSQLFLRALQTALKNEPETAKLRLPFWIEEAIQIIQRIEGNENMAATANTFLNQYNLDLKVLETRLKNQDVSLYNIIRSLCQHVHGVAPDLGGHINLHEAVEWVARELCGPEDGKPFSGLLILFDEFSAFIRNYATRETPGNPLQDLLDGVSNCKGRVVLVAFGQSDPDSSVNSIFLSRPNRDAEAALLLELERFPKSFRFQLYTTMESVLDSYLTQDNKRLCEVFHDTNSWPSVTDANDDCLTLFRTRYERELKWNSEKYQEVVTLGCFPLHPLTASLLCNIHLIEVATPRSVLGFVSEHVKALADTEVAADGNPTWIRAFELVDWFDAQLADDEWNRYKEAIKQRGGDATQEELKVLKAMLLHFLAQMPTQEVSFTTAISHLTGLSTEDVKARLQKLAEATVIDYFPTTNKYSFFPLGGGAQSLLEHVNKRISGRSMTWEQWCKVNGSIGMNGLPVTAISVLWGHPDDWVTPHFYLPQDYATADRVKELVSNYHGCVIWCVARLDSEVEWFEKNASLLFGGLTKKTPLPVVLVLPDRSSRALVESLHRQLVLNSLSPQETLQYGSHIVENLKTQSAANVKKEAETFFETPRCWRVPDAYAAALRHDGEPKSVESAAHKLCRIAYSIGPTAFYTQYKMSTSNLKNGVIEICKHLLINDVYKGQYGGNRIAVGIVDNFLMVGKSTSWGTLSQEKRLQEPQADHTVKAWDVLNQQIPDDGKEADIRPAIKTLLEPPFGYDYNTLSLLFCSWYGYYRHDLQLSLRGVASGVEELVQEIDKGPANFIKLFNEPTLPIHISRRNRTKAAQEIKEIAQRVQHLCQNPFTSQEARDACTKLGEYLADENNPEPEKKQANETKEIIKEALKQAAKYDEDVSRLLKDAGTSKDVQKLVGLLEQVKMLQPSSGVISGQIPIDKVYEKLRGQLTGAVDHFCQNKEVLREITHYEANRLHLQEVNNVLEDHEDLKARVELALKTLDGAKQTLLNKQNDDTAISMLSMITASGSLSEIRDNLIRVREISCLSEEAKSIQTKKENVLAKAITDLETFAAEVKDQVTSIKSQQQLKKVHGNINEHRLLFAETVELKQIDVASEMCKQLEQFFLELDRLEPDNFETKKEYSELLERIEGLPSKFLQVIGEPQQSVISEMKTRVASRVTSLQKTAANWLNRMEEEVRRAKDLQKLLNKLNDPPDFLEEDKQNKLQNLKTKVEQAIEHAEQEEKSRQKDEILLSTLRAISAEGPLAELQKNLNLIKKMEFTTKDAQGEQTKKKGVIEKSIDSLVSFAQGLNTKIDRVTNDGALTQLRISITERRLMFKGTTEMSIIQEADDRCILIENLLRDISEIKTTRLNCLGDYEDAVSKLKKLIQTYKNMVSQSQEELLSKVEDNITSDLQKKKDQSEKWLTEAQARLEKGQNLEQLLRELESPPAFLSKAKLTSLNRMKADLEKKLAEDLRGRILQLFKKISDKSVQERLVEELRTMIQK